MLSEALYIAEKEREVGAPSEDVLDFDALYQKIVDGTGFEIVGFGRDVLEEKCPSRTSLSSTTGSSRPRLSSMGQKSSP